MSTSDTLTTGQSRLSRFTFAPEPHDNPRVAVASAASLRGRVAIVSGGASGIARAIATELAQHGADVAIIHHGQPHPAETLCSVIQSFGSKSLAIDTDITNEIACAHMVADVFDHLGVVDILVHFADFRTETPIHLLHRKDWDLVVHEGLGGAYNLTRALINPMRQHGGGRVIFVVETPWRQNRRQYGQVMTGESAITGLARALAVENAARGITVNCVATGIFETPRTVELTSKERERISGMVPAARMGRPEEAARLVAFLASDDASYITGQLIAIDGGLSI
ncbi:MAG TPA: SDR family NAD(P)-dependent oxidoreductase [bacterium]|nr:SDR family NAD(P)-dependent oxidoreductase [bacterium]